MRILYIAAENPAVDAILSGMDTNALSGLPAFYYPFKYLLDRGNVIDLLLYSLEERTVIESKYFKTENLIQLHPKNGMLPSAVEYALQLCAAVRRLLNERQYDFVYGMSEGAHLAVHEAIKRGIPSGLRQFGTQEMANVLEPMKCMLMRRIKALKDYTYITLSMQSKKTFLLATDDGSRANELYSILGIKKKKYLFFFWHSGVFVPQTKPIVDFEKSGLYPHTYDPMALSMVNRIADVKRQDRAVQILRELHRRGYLFHLYFIGGVSSQTMLDITKKLIKDNGVEDYVHFEGNKTQRDCREYARNSFATLLPCEWNRVNVFYEAMGEGSIVVTNNNHSIDEFIEPDINCLLYEEDNFAQAAEKIIALTNDSIRVKAIRDAAYRTAKEKFLSLEERFSMEVLLVEDAARGRDLSKYPEFI